MNGQKKAKRSFNARELASATVVIIIVAILGLVLFGLTIVGTQYLSASILDPQQLEPGLGLSNQGLTIAFALAGAVASTAVAFAALRAQQSATEAQEESMSQAERLRSDRVKREFYATLQADIEKHRTVIKKLNEVFQVAHEITEDLLYEIASSTAKHSESSSDRSDADNIRASLVGLDRNTQRSRADSLIAAHRAFWKAVEEAQACQLSELTIDGLWRDTFQAGDSPRSHLRTLTEKFGFFGSTDIAVSPATIGPRSSPMTPAIARDVISLARIGGREVLEMRVKRGVRQRIAETLAARQESVNLNSEIEEVNATVHRISSAAQSISARLTGISQAIKEVAAWHMPDPVDLSDFDTKAADLLRQLSEQLKETHSEVSRIRRSLPYLEDAAIDADFAEQKLGGQIEAVSTTIDELSGELATAIGAANQNSLSKLILARHSGGYGDRSILGLTAFLVGAVILPDGAVLALGRDHGEMTDGEVKVNLGLAFCEDLSRLYLQRCGDVKTGQLDLQKLLPDSQQFKARGFANAYGEDREQYVPSSPVAFDALWQRIRTDEVALLAHFLHEGGNGLFPVETNDSVLGDDGLSLKSIFHGDERLPVDIRLVPDGKLVDPPKFDKRTATDRDGNPIPF